MSCPRRLRWRTNDLAIWDDRCAMHYAVNDYDGARRLMHRTTIKGELTISAHGKNAQTAITPAR